MRKLIDQAAHVAFAVAFLLPAALWPGMASFALAGAGFGLVREITETGLRLSIATLRAAINRKSVIDVTFWAIGGIIAGLIA